MDGSSLQRVPVGPGTERWRTFDSQRTVVVAARTVTSTVRMLEVLPQLLRGDERVCVVFAYDPTSAFSGGVLDLLNSSGCQVMPWEQLAEVPADLILSASENIDPPGGDCPVLVLPHGIGFHKQVPDSRGEGTRLSGLVPDRLLKRALLAVSHPDQAAQLAAWYPQTAGSTVMVGDPCYDRLLVSTPQRDVHRRAQGVGADSRLVVVSSTWGPTSLNARDPGLLSRLLSQLPLDEYRLAAVLHPNVWSAHGAWQIRVLLAAALEAGLVLVPPTRGWQGAVVAADAIVGDHGSVTLYGAALDRPVLLGAYGADAVPGTAVAELGCRAPRLDGGRPVRAQVEDLIDTHQPGRWSDLAEQTFAAPGEAAVRLRRLVYELIGLAEPVPGPSVPAFPPPLTRCAQVTSTVVSLRQATPGEAWQLRMERYPGPVAALGEEASGEMRYLACDTGEPDPKRLLNASVLVVSQAQPGPAAAVAAAEGALARNPGCLLAAAAADDGRCVVVLRHGPVLAVGPTGDVTLAAAAAYACLRRQVRLDTAVQLSISLGAGPAHPLSLLPLPAGTCEASQFS